MPIAVVVCAHKIFRFQSISHHNVMKHTCNEENSLHSLQAISIRLHTCTNFLLPVHTISCQELGLHALQTGLLLFLNLQVRSQLFGHAFVC